MWDPTHLCLQMEWHDMSSILLCSKYITNAKYSSHEIQPPPNTKSTITKHQRLSNMILEMCKAVCKLLYTRRWPPFEERQELVQQRPWRKVQFRALSFEQSCALHCWGEGGGVTWKGPIESRASRGSGSWQPCALYSSHRHIAIPVMRWMTTQLKVGISQLSKLLGPAIMKIVPAIAKSWWWYAWHWQEARYNSKLTFRWACQL